MTIRKSIDEILGRRVTLLAALGLFFIAIWIWPAATQGQAPSSVPPPESVIPAPVDAKLLLIGSLASSHVYTTYGYIGVVADNAQKDIYTPQRVEDLMNEVTVISDSLTGQLTALLKSDLTPEDAKAVQEIVEIYGLLKQESVALRKYAKDKNETNGTEFRRLRDQAWIRVAKLLDPLETPAVK